MSAGAGTGPGSKHAAILEELVADARANEAVCGFLVFGSVARGTQRADSDIDVLSVLEAKKRSSGIRNRVVEGIKVGDLYFSRSVLMDSLESVPYLLHPLAEASLLFDRDGTISPLLDRLRAYFDEHPEIVAEWRVYAEQLRAEKAAYGYEKTTIIDVWNELEARHSGGRVRRQFFDAFYFTNPRIFSLLKRLM